LRPCSAEYLEQGRPCEETFEGHFSLGCHFHVHLSNLWQAFASRGLPAIAELLVVTVTKISLNGSVNNNRTTLI